MTEQLTPRPLAIRFAGHMEAKLRENDHKTGWLTGPRAAPRQHSPPGHFRDKLEEEARELLNALAENAPVEELVEEAADVANMAAMIDDRARYGIDTQEDGDDS